MISMNLSTSQMGKKKTFKLKVMEKNTNSIFPKMNQAIVINSIYGIKQIQYIITRITLLKEQIT